MATLQVSMVNKDGLRLTVSTTTAFRTVGHENEAIRRVIEETNADENHGVYAPWEYNGSSYIRD